MLSPFVVADPTAPTVEEVDQEIALRRLMTFIPTVSRKYQPPTHLKPLLDRFEFAVKGIPQFVCCDAPPRHAKTESVLHVPAFALRQRPDLTFSYSTYADALSRSKSRKARRLALNVGVKLDKTAVGEWRTPEGGGLIAGGVGGPLVGHGVNIGIVDDPIKLREQADSPAYRERLIEFITDVLTTRIEPGGSIFVFMTRWDPNDLIGTLVADFGYEHIHLPAIRTDSDGTEHALWPERWPLEALQKKRSKAGEYTWQSIYMGNPRSRGAPVFDLAKLKSYRELPVVFRTAIGIDIAYTKKTSADWSVLVKMVACNGEYYVVDVIRRRVTAPVFQETCHVVAGQNPNATWRWYYAAGLEKAAGEFFDTGPNAVPIQPTQTTADKFTRSLKFAAAWAGGHVHVPENAPWLADWRKEHENFTGLDDPRDDQVDATVAAFDELDVGDVRVHSDVTAATRRGAFEQIGM